MAFWGGSEILDPFGNVLAKARYYDEDLVVGEIALETVRRKRTVAPLLRDEDLDLTINELMRIRERPTATQPLRVSAAQQKGRKPKQQATKVSKTKKRR